MSPRQTRSRTKREKEEKEKQQEDPVPTRSRCFSNLTNKTPKSIPMSKEKQKRQIIITTREDSTYDSTGVIIPTSEPTLKVILSQIPPEIEISDQKPTGTLRKQSSSGAAVTSQVSTLTVPPHLLDCVLMSRALRKILETHMKDAGQRLHLDIFPAYLYDLKAYAKLCQKQKLQFASHSKKSLAMSYVEEERHFQFTHHVRATMCGPREFPGTEVIFTILEQILKLPHENESESTVPELQTLRDLHSLFTNIIDIFPVEAFRTYYNEVFQKTFIVSESPAKKKVQKGVLQVVLESVSDLIHHQDEVKVKSKTTDFNKITNFYYWDAKCQEEASFAYFPRNEKFDRFFMILDLLARVLESDLAMFTVEHLNTLHSSINSEGPLIRYLIWKDEDVTGVNVQVKNIISDFIKMIGMNYPKSKIRIMSRVLNLIVQTANLCEYIDGGTKYPTYGQLTKDLVHEISKTLENSVYYSVDFVIRVSEMIQSPLIRMLVTHKTLESIHKATYDISLRVPFQSILVKEFTKFKDDVASSARTKQETYPIYNGTTKPDGFIITQENYLKLVKMFAESFDGFYHISKASKVDPREEKIEETMKKPEPLIDVFFAKMFEGIDLNEKVVLRGVDLNYRTSRSVKCDMPMLEFYRDECKYMSAFVKLIEKCRIKYPEKFKSWDRFVKATKV